jgi:MFS family permease
VTIWELGEAVGPLLIAPLSEEFGRRPVFNAANAVFAASTLLAARAADVPLFVAARALTGLAVASNVLAPSVVGDLFPDAERGLAVSVVMLAPLVGGAVGPSVGSLVADRWGWRSVVVAAGVLAAACEGLFLVFFRETYKIAILRGRAERLEARYHRHVHAPVVDQHAGKTNWVRRFWEPVARPAEVLFSSGVLIALSIFGSVVYTTFYIMSVTLPDILEDVYSVPTAVQGSTFMIFSTDFPFPSVPTHTPP